MDNASASKTKDSLLKGASNVADDSINHLKSTDNKVTHRVDIKGDAATEPDLFDRELPLEVEDSLSSTGNTAKFEPEKLDETIAVSPGLSSRVEVEEPIIDHEAYTVADYDMDETKKPSFWKRLRSTFNNAVDPDIFDSFAVNSRRRIMLIIGIVIMVALVCTCIWVSFYLSNILNGGSSKSSSTATSNATINDDQNSNFSGLWGGFGSISTSTATSVSSGASTKEVITIKPNDKPFEQKDISDLVLDTSEAIPGKFSIYKRSYLKLTDYNYSYSDTTGSTVMTKYGWKSGFISVLSGSNGNNSYQINQVLSRVPESSIPGILDDPQINFNYAGCKVFDLENVVEVTDGTARLYKVVCFGSSKYSTNSNGFLMARYARKNIYGVIETIGTNDLTFIRTLVKLSMSKLD